MALTKQKHNAQYYIDNKERIRARKRELYQENIEKMRLKGRRQAKKFAVKRKKWREDNKEKLRLWKIRHYELHPEIKKKARFNATIAKLGIKLLQEEHDAMVKKQKNRCAICGKKEAKRAISIDHNHKTKKVRGLLCHQCNIGLGMFRDSPSLLKKAIKYLNQK